MCKGLLNEYEAALKFDLSPTLLRWLTSYSVVDKQKLEFKVKHDVYYYKIDDLTVINQKMEGKWPKTKKGKRPSVPSGIKDEIKSEARHACPVCNRSHGEIAHIDPVAATHCNHPKNLIYLCPNHHTEYDNALIPSNVNRNDVLSLKKSLQIFQRAIWKIKGELIQSYLGALNSAISLLNVHEQIKDIIPESDFEETLADISKLSQNFSSDGNDKFDFKNIDTLKYKAKSYIEENKDDICPLCSGNGFTDYYDSCPVCLGDGEIAQERLKVLDLSIYDLVDCKLCDGSGVHDGDDCRGCGGDRQVSQYFYDSHDWSMYDLVDCKLCDGSGVHDGDDCRGCGGDRQVSQYFYDTHDWSMYDLVDCKLCDGSGVHDGDDCLGCGGDRQVSQHFYDTHDWSMYDLVDCKACNGSGVDNGDDCRLCCGERKIPNYLSEGYY
ncbi:HNH endonuclease [Vibrio splendidus]|uniref:HNH endonuclease n=1 Tax=Vibrio splendidus TaxID=29497 RepID=UPI0024689085|nr:HNH endonuclease [Vibrio splendidus]MDH6017702.1 hypothetical protein [Vibrio splendidus]